MKFLDLARVPVAHSDDLPLQIAPLIELTSDQRIAFTNIATA